MISRAALLMPGGWAPSKLRKISLLNKCIAQCRNRHTAAIVTPPRSSHRHYCHAAAAIFAQLLILNHPLHLSDRSMLVSFLKHPNRVHVQQYRLVILNLFGQHKTFLLQWFAHTAQGVTHFVTRLLCPMLLYMNAVNTKILTNLFPYLHTDLNLAFKTEFPCFFHPEKNCCQISKKKLRPCFFHPEQNCCQISNVQLRSRLCLSSCSLYMTELHHS